MGSCVMKSTLLKRGLAASVLLFASGLAMADSTVTLTAGPTSTTLPDLPVLAPAPTPGAIEPEIAARVHADVQWACPAAAGLAPLEARSVKERRATFAAEPGFAARRPGPRADARDRKSTRLNSSHRT